MAEIKPVRAWRYTKKYNDNIGELTSPLFDVVSEKQRNILYQNPYNSIHLSVPKPPNGAEHAASLLAEWKQGGILSQDKLPAIYVYYQYFTLPESSEEFCRKGFVCNIRAYDWNEHVILRHENTIPDSVNDRAELLEKTELNVSPTFGLYTDGNFALEQYMDEAIKQPVYETEDYQGARDVLAIIHDATAIQKFIDVLKDKKIILADGHHRYEGSLIHKHKKQRENPSHTGKEGYNFHMMFLSNTEAGGLKILATHRLINGIENLETKKIISELAHDFNISAAPEPFALPEVIAGKKWTFGVILKEGSYVITLKPNSFPKLRWPFPPAVKSLDLTVLHYFIIEKILGIPGQTQLQSSAINFERNLPDCIAAVADGRAQLALITNNISIEEVKEVCDSGSVMPQKSTYFYPKVMCGFLFGSIREDEFRSPDFSPF